MAQRRVVSVNRQDKRTLVKPDPEEVIYTVNSSESERRPTQSSSNLEWSAAEVSRVWDSTQLQQREKKSVGRM
jgi:hypothetical protein